MNSVERYKTCSFLMLRRCICTPPCSPLCGWNLVVTGAS